MKKLSENALMMGIPPEVVADLEKKAKRFDFPAGSTLFNEGDEGNVVYLLESGVVQVLKKFQTDRAILLEELMEGNFLGELALLDRQGRSATAKASTRVTGWSFDDTILDALLTKGKDVVIHFLSTLAARMRQVNATLIRQKEASERLTLLGNMVGGIVHDLKNPLAAMRMSAELLEMKTQDDKSKRVAVLLLQQIDRLTAMTHELLEFARDRIELKKILARLDDLVARCHDFFAETCRSADIAFELKLNAPRRIEIDPAKLERVITNLVKNAIQALKGHSGAKIVLETSQGDQETCIVISDNGPGVPETIRNMLFEPFVTAGKKDGTGLGLTIVRKVVESHGGKVAYQTETGKGTTFRLFLPG